MGYYHVGNTYIYIVCVLVFIMVKRNATLTIDGGILDKAKHLGINISDTAEKALIKKAGDTLMADDDDKQCDRCGVKKSETDRKFYWLCPDEVWICSKCDKNIIERIKMDVARRA